MTEQEEMVGAAVEWICPVCNSTTNSLGIQFSGSRAVSLHIAGKIRTGDSLHKSWAISKAGEVITEPDAKHSINTIADQLEWYVTEDRRIRLQHEEEEIKHLVEEKKGKEEARISAYRYIQRIETSLHSHISHILHDSFGDEESEWWVKGIPPQIRIECAQRREEDPLREELYSYIDLIDLKSIIDKNWSIFAPFFQHVRGNINSKRKFLAAIAKINDVRKRVMHPIRMRVTDEDVSFLEQFSEIVKVFVQGV